MRRRQFEPGMAATVVMPALFIVGRLLKYVASPKPQITNLITNYCFAGVFRAFSEPSARASIKTMSFWPT